MEKKIEFVSSLQRHSRVEYYFIILPKEVVVKKSKYLTDWLMTNKDVHVTLSPVGDPERNRRIEDQEPDYKAILDEIKEYMNEEEYRIRTKGYAQVSRASRGLERLAKIISKHTSQAGVKKEEK